VRILPFTPPAESGTVLGETLGVLGRGGVIAYPTETVYGLGCDAFQAEAVHRIRELKGRQAERSFLVLVGSAEDAFPLVDGVSPAAVRIIRTFWPGPLTLVFRAARHYREILADGRGTIGIRVSPDPVCRAILGRFRNPLVSTSANPAGREPACTAAEVAVYFPVGLDLILDGGERASKMPSTVIDVSGPVPLLLRRGSISRESLERSAGDILEAASV